jgi:hypothetical protein
MYPMTPAKVNAATITMANMAAPPGGSFLSVLDTPKKEWSIPLSPDSGSLFLPGAPEALAKRRSAAAKYFSNSMATDNPSRFRTCAPALVVFGNRYPRGLRFYARTDLAAIRRPRQAALSYRWVAAIAQSDGPGTTLEDRSPTLPDGATQSPGRADLPSSCP